MASNAGLLPDGSSFGSTESEDGSITASRSRSHMQSGNTPDSTRQSWSQKITTLTLVFFGFQGDNREERRSLVWLVWNLAFGFVQFVGIWLLLILAGMHDSPTVSGTSQWEACPSLAIWNMIWMVRVAFACILCYWTWRRVCVIRERPGVHGVASSPSTPASAVAVAETISEQASSANPAPSFWLAHTIAYYISEMSLHILTIAWWCSVWIIPTRGSCHEDSPILWWTASGTTVLVNLMFIIESGTVVHRYLSSVWTSYVSDVRKLSTSKVDQIPLVLYIPAPPGISLSNRSNGGDAEWESEDYSKFQPTSTLVAMLKAASRIRFSALWRRSPAVSRANAVDHDEVERLIARDPWEAMWEKGDYPFIQLERHRATCSICLEDYEEPRKIHNPPLNEPEGSSMESEPLRLLSCGHVFHKSCADSWLTQKSGRCPSCRAPVKLAKQRKW